MIEGSTSKIEDLTGTLTASKLGVTGVLNAEEGLIGKVSVSVKDVPYYETTNSSGGTTVYIAKEVMKNGCK